MRQTVALDRIDHIAIPAADVSSAVEWYRGLFRCDVVYQDGTWALLRFGNVRLAIVVPEQHPPHLGFVSPEAETFGPLVPHRDGTRSIYVTDPAGNAVEILEPYSEGGEGDV